MNSDDIESFLGKLFCTSFPEDGGNGFSYITT